jgi:predicted Zn-dependent protease
MTKTPASLRSDPRPLCSTPLAGLLRNHWPISAEYAPYSREHEFEADHIGLLYMAKAGDEPSEAIKFWGRMEKSEGRTSWDLLSTHPTHENRRARLQGWLPEAMIYFTDQSRPLPSTLSEVETAVRSRGESSALAPEGMRPSYSHGFWGRAKVNNRSAPTTTT